MTPCPSCGAHVRPGAACPSCDAHPRGRSPGVAAAVLLALTTGCVGVSTGEKDASHSGDGSTSTAMPAYGITVTDTDTFVTDTDTDTDTDAVPDGTYIGCCTHSGGGSGAGGSGTH